MSQSQFAVKPVKQYEGARYLAASGEEGPVEEPLEERHHPLTYALLLLIVLGLAVGLLGCYLRSDYQPDPIDVPDPPDPPDPPLPPGCDEALRCADAWTLERCDDGEWSAQSCTEYCEETFGWDYSSQGCDVTAEDPCQCSFDVLDGGMDLCDPARLACLDGQTLEYCADHGSYETASCEDWCDEQFGVDYRSLGCDSSTPENPCMCFEDLLDGLVASCDPEDLRCTDDLTLELCVDGTPVLADCNERCVEVNGSYWYSQGCDAAAEDPCQCAYGMVDGGMMECGPGDVYCVDDESLAICEDHSFEFVSCAEVCVEALGEGATSGGCDASDLDDPCRCAGGDSGSGE